MATSIPTPGSPNVTAPLPPVNASTVPKGASDGSGPTGGLMASLMSGIAPVKAAVDSILAACQQVVRSGAVPGAEQVCGQIVALAQGLLPLAAQNVLQPVGGQAGAGASGGMGAGSPGPVPPPPGAPPPPM